MDIKITLEIGTEKFGAFYPGDYADRVSGERFGEIVAFTINNYRGYDMAAPSLVPEEN